MSQGQRMAGHSLHGPTDKERKYDRQLRLWAASGQAALESAHVLLVNTGTGTVGFETLKNLVLPGIGRFTVADGATVKDPDLGVNFFLDEVCLGKSRALCCRDYLVELNPEVQGDWFPKDNADLDIGKLISLSPPFTIILYTLPLNLNHVRSLEIHAEQHNIPLLAVHSSGFYAYFTVKLHTLLPIVDTHPDEAATADLRLLYPWAQLSDFARDLTGDIDHQSDHNHGHLPWVAILLHYLEKWKAANGGVMPSTYSQKTTFRDFVAQGTRRNNPEGGEENFDEAVAAVMKHVSQSSLSVSLQEVFNLEDKAQISDHQVENFWIIAKAVKQFYHMHHQLPLPGGVPDMKAQSDVYMELQSIYKSKARQDADEVMRMVRAMTGGERIERHEVVLFCKNAKFIKLLLGSHDAPSIHQVVENELLNDELAETTGFQTPYSLIPIYLALNSLASAPKASPGEIVEHVTNFVPKLAGNQRLFQVAQELSRSDSGELHNVSALIGGMVAQEMIKIMTGQYVPIDNTCIFDGIESRCQILRLSLDGNWAGHGVDA
ncbi:hypothetical protein QQS21_008794 [Conoideocrella luteorostrata]|uniref:NEDD8-activating enzyme E1 regulatory subunit n=1 Tax=Conoideocrella luteorostrata TaxID=1105319 RepID=A0AAJ0CKH6_9HYPO|nr:hypothetical protein QQS21_008794 [Conoideocrella luteorostrata]